MTAPVFVDTNVWVYAVDGADPRKREKALAVVAPERGREIVISSQVLTEFYAVATRKLATPLSILEAEMMVATMATLPVVAVDASLVRSAIAGSRTWGISIWDALIMRAAEVAGCGVLVSEDLSAGGVYGSVRVENPFTG